MADLNTLLFDLDGTLIDTNAIIAESYHYTYQKHLPELNLSEETIVEQIGPPLRTIFSLYTEDLSVISNMIETYREYYLANEKKHTQLYPGVYEALEELKSLNCNLGIVTSKAHISALPSLFRHKIYSFFDVIVALDDVKHPKPNPESVLKALAHFPNTSQAMMIGDNQSDIMAGKNAGVLTAGVAWSIKGVPHLQEVDPDYLFYTMNELVTLIKKKKEALK